MAESIEGLELHATKIKVERSVKLTAGKSPTDEESRSEENVIEIHKFTTTPAMATVEIPVKFSKDYQSIGLTIGVSLPCYAEELDEGMKKAYTMSIERLQKEIPDLKTMLDRMSPRRR